MPGRYWRLKRTVLQSRAALETIRRKLSVRETERLVRSIRIKKSQKQTAAVDSAISDLENKLSRRLMTKVKINPAKKGGTMEIKYFSPADLERLISILLGDG